MRTAFIIMMATGALVAGQPATAQETDTFGTGPVFGDFGPHAPVEGIAPFPDDTRFAHAFDVAEAGSGKARNRDFESAARFVNMHVAAGVDRDNIRVAVVVHGGAVRDLLTDDAWSADGRGEANPSSSMVRAMMDAGVRFIVCGQSAAGQGIARDELIPDVEMALSAMTAHALLQQRGYTVNPF